MSSDFLRVETENRGVLRVTLNRPEARNALNASLIGALNRTVQAAATRPEWRCLVLEGAGPVFCAGGDLHWLRSGGSGEFDANRREIERLVTLLRSLNELPIPVVAAVQGAAIGGGVGLVSVADAVVCSAETVFSLSESRLGLVPSCIAPFLAQKIGVSWTRRYMVTGERFDAAAARSVGLAHEVVPLPGDLPAAVDQVVRSVLKGAPGAAAATKQAIHRLTWPEERARIENWEAYAVEVFARSRSGPEAQEGLTARIEKREPKWQVEG